MKVLQILPHLRNAAKNLIKSLLGEKLTQQVSTRSEFCCEADPREGAADSPTPQKCG